MFTLQQIKNKLKLFVTHQNSFHPSVFLIQCLYVSIFKTFTYEITVLIFSITLMLLFQRPYFFYSGIFILPSLGPIGFLSCNEYWKLILYIYAFVNFFTIPYEKINFIINISILAIYAYTTYTKLIFRNIRDNVIYFVGFCGLLVIYCLHTIFSFQQLDYYSFRYGYLIFIILGIASSFTAIKSRLWTLTNSQLQQLTSTSQVIHYIQLVIKRFKQKQCGLQQTHRANCYRDLCFCKTDTSISFSQNYIRQLYQQALIKFNWGYLRDYLHYMYTEYLLQQKLFPHAMQNILKYKPSQWNIFKYVQHQRLYISLDQHLKKIQQEYEIKIEIQDPFIYDIQIQHLKRSLTKLINMKINFWIQIMKPHAKIKILKTLGSEFLKLLNQINRFYQSELEKVEKEMMSTLGGMIYNLFLFVATNYREKAEQNMKNLKKYNDGRNNIKSYKFGVIKVGLCDNRLGVIENMNAALAKLLEINSKKYQIIGQPMDFMVPKSYLFQHNRGITMLKQHNIHSLIGTEQNLVPILTVNNNLINCTIMSKYSNDIRNQLSVICFIKHFKSNGDYILLNSDDQIEATNTTDFDCNLVDVKEVQSVIKMFRNKWNNILPGQNHSSLQSVQIQIKFNGVNYICTINSPMSRFFYYPRKPPIHISFVDGSYVIYDLQVDGVQRQAMQKIKNIIDNQSQSQASVITKKQQIIDVLKDFKKNSSLRLFYYYYPVVILSVVLGVVFVTVQVMLIKLDWIDIHNQNNNIISLLNTQYDIQQGIARVVGKGLSLYGIDQNKITNNEYSKIYGVSNYYDTTRRDILKICQNLTNLVVKQNKQKPITKSSSYQNIRQKELKVITKSAEQIVLFYNLFEVVLSNCYFLADNISLQNSILGQIYWNTIFDQHFLIIQSLKSLIFEKLRWQNIMNFIVLIGMIGVFVLCLLFVYSGNKRIEKQQDYVFQLIASIPLEYIHDQINNLVQLDLSLRVQSPSVTFHFSQQHIIDTQSDKMPLKTLNSQKRNKTGQLDTKGTRKPRITFYLMVSIFICFLVLIILIKNFQIQDLKSHVQNVIKIKQWRNQRLNLLVHMKKYLFKFTSLQNQSELNLESTIQTLIDYRKLHYFNGGLQDIIKIQCTQRNNICVNETTSEQSLNVFFQSIITSIFIDKNIKQIPLQQFIQQSSSMIIRGKDIDREKEISQLVLFYHNLGIIVLIVSWVCFILFMIFIILYLNRLKQQYINLTMFIALLNQEMITKSKRVQSFIQRLGTHED